MLVVILHAELKLFLYGNIVSINSTIYGETYGLHGEKKSKSNESGSCTKDTFSQSFLSINFYFHGFPEKKKLCQTSLPYVAVAP